MAEKLLQILYTHLPITVKQKISNFTEECMDRLEAFEKMLSAVQADYTTTVEKMAQLKAAGKEKSATYRQLMGNKLQLQSILTRYQVYGLIEKL